MGKPTLPEGIPKVLLVAPTASPTTKYKENDMKVCINCNDIETAQGEQNDGYCMRCGGNMKEVK